MKSSSLATFFYTSGLPTCSRFADCVCIVQRCMHSIHAPVYVILTPATKRQKESVHGGRVKSKTGLVCADVELFASA